MTTAARRLPTAAPAAAPSRARSSASMARILFQRVDGQPAAAPVDVPRSRSRRRLSALVKRHANRSRPFIVSVHRRKHVLSVTDMSVRMRKEWPSTLIGPHDTVIITYLPRGGGGAAGGANGRQKGASIGLLVATIALAAVGQFWAIPALVGAGFSTAVAGTIWAAGSAALLAGGAYLLSKATQAKANKEQDNRPVYGVSGGGNQPRSGDRIPVIYGRCWTSPDLSQPDYTVYVGDDSQDLYKRLTIGCGKYALKSVRVSNVMMWTADGGLTPAFTGSQLELILPGTTSGLVPGQVATVSAVGSNTLPRATDFPAWAGPFEFGSGAPQQQRIQLDFSVPQGCFAIPDSGKFQGKQFPANWGVTFQYAPCDLDGTPTGPFVTLWSEGGYVLSTRPMRFSRFVDIPLGRYTFRAQNTGDPASIPHPDGFNAIVTNPVIWEGLRAHIPEAAVRPGITELAIRVRAGKELSVTSFGEVEVEVARILPAWNGSAWVEEETDKAVWAAADILRDSSHGAGISDSAIDVARLLHYATAGAPFNTFSGIIRGPVSVYEALSTVLGAMRASPLRLGSSWTMVRDEPKAVRKHIISRRQILKDTSGQTFTLDLSDGSADVIVEWNADGDPRRRREHRVTFGTQTPNPRRMQAFGARTAEHAIHLATWAAVTAYRRRERRSFSMELAGRMLLPNDAALVDTWYFDALQTAGVLDADIDRGEGYFALAIDSEFELPASPFAYLRGRDGLEWGPVGVTRDGVRLLLNAADVAQAESLTGVVLEDILNTATQAFTTMVVGELTTLQEGWLIRSIQFSGDTQVNVEAVYDSPEVWSALAEPIIVPPPPPSSGLENDASVTIAYVRGKAVQRNGAMFMDWVVGRSTGAATYAVRISYDNWVTDETVYRGQSSSGTHPLREFEGTIRIRARGISASGLIGPEVESAFSLAPALFDLSNATDGTLQYRKFLEGMEPVAIVDELPDLFGYDGPKFVTIREPGADKPTLYRLADDGLSWNKLAAEDYVANTITAAAIQAGAVKASAIDVDYLSAISAFLGDILGGSLNINNRFMVDASGTVTIMNAASGARLVITNTLLQVFDASNVLRVRLGLW